MEYAVQEILIVSVVGYGFAGSVLATDTFVGAHPDVAFTVFSYSMDVGIPEPVGCRINVVMQVVDIFKMHQTFSSGYPHRTPMILQNLTDGI